MARPAPAVTVVIPTHDRAGSIARAISGCLRQTPAPAEVLVVDDCSTDGTREVVESIAAGDARVRLIRLDRRSGGAAARNAGILAARGGFVAFLDSDDEWLEGHLARKLGALRDSGAGLAFGAFFQDDGKRRIERRCRQLAGDPLEYVFLGRGGIRTSTFVAKAENLREVMFDDAQLKHQDWDLVVNFGKRFPVTADGTATAVLHMGGTDRLSAGLDYDASKRFLVKNRDACTRTGRLLFAAFVIDRAFHAGGPNGPQLPRYLDLAGEIDPRARYAIGFLLPLLRVPRIGSRLFRAATRLYCRLTS